MAGVGSVSVELLATELSLGLDDGQHRDESLQSLAGVAQVDDLAGDVMVETVYSRGLLVHEKLGAVRELFVPATTHFSFRSDRVIRRRSCQLVI